MAGHVNFWGVKALETVVPQAFPPAASILLASFGGDGEIRTLDTLLRYTRFPIVRARPATRHLLTATWSIIHGPGEKVNRENRKIHGNQFSTH